MISLLLRKAGDLAARSVPSLFLILLCVGLSAGAAAAQESPFFIAYDDQLEELGNLEIAVNPLLASQRPPGRALGGMPAVHGGPPAVGLAKGRADRGGDGFLASSTELEYGVKGWWTTELYLDGQATRGDSTVLTGWRWENRWRPLLREHWINPVLYVELEDVDAADKTMLEVVGHDVESDHATPNREARRERQREAETKLILASHVADWNLAGNFIAEKNLAGPVWEFGYALGASRPLALAALPYQCTLCAENFTAGVEMYGGLGDAQGFGLRDTSHYLAAVVAWSLPSGTTLRLSPAFGLNSNSHRFLLRLGISHEISDVARRVRHALRAEDGGHDLGAVLAGRKLYVRHCAECHGGDARGGPRAPSLDTSRVGEAPPGDLFRFLTNGRLRAGMPAWARLPAAQRWQLTSYLKALGGAPAR